MKMRSQTRRVLVAAVAITFAVPATLLISAAMAESTHEKAAHTWQMRFTIHEGRESVGSIDGRDSDEHIAKIIRKTIRPVFDVTTSEEGKSVATLVIEHGRVHTSGSSGWEKLRNRIKSNLGMGYQEAGTIFTCKHDFIHNPSGGITLGQGTSEGLEPRIEFSPGGSSDDRAATAAGTIVRDFREVFAAGVGMD